MQTGIAIGWAGLLLGTCLAFAKLPPRHAALLVFFGGWLLAPVGPFPPGSSQAVHPYWILGAALPSDMLLHKAWVVPVCVLLGTLVFDRGALRRLRPGWLDAPVLAWCLWPLLQSAALVDAAVPSGALASAYLALSWGATWLVGRLYCADAEGLADLARALALTGAACLPLAVVEGLGGAQLYGWFLEPHPFRDDGNERYWLWRPLGAFENGNQYGLWVALCALVAAWWAASRRPASPFWRVVAATAVAVALAAQSVGALMLAALGALLLWLSARARPRLLLGGGLAAAVLLSAVYISGVVPVTGLANDTAIGRATVGAIKSIGRGSFTWRIAQDQRALPLATEHALSGSGRWDWWRPQPSRPWGLALLLLGQYGLVGVALASSTLLGPVMRLAWRVPRRPPLAPQALPWLLAIVVLLAMLDAVLNSFVFFPALLIAGALATPEPRDA
jgi:hypothetical protein